MSDKLKTCSKCGAAKPANTDNFQRSCHSRDGLANICKACFSVRIKAALARSRAQELFVGARKPEMAGERAKPERRNPGAHHRNRTSALDAMEREWTRQVAAKATEIETCDCGCRRPLSGRTIVVMWPNRYLADHEPRHGQA